MPSGAVRFHATGAAPPAGIVTVSGRPVVRCGCRSTFAVTFIGLFVPFLSVKLAANQSPLRTSGGIPEYIARSCAVLTLVDPLPHSTAPSFAIATSLYYASVSRSAPWILAPPSGATPQWHFPTSPARHAKGG